MSVDGFFAYARERHRIFLRREAGEDPPWTKDPILREFRFCNVFRENDRTTRWIRPRITLERCGERLVGSMLAARWLNYIPSLERSEQALVDWDFGALPGLLAGMRQVVTGAYVINTRAADMAMRRAGKGPLTKVEGIVWCLEQSRERLLALQRRIRPGETTLQEVTAALAELPSQGPFTAYETATDLRWTPLLDRAPDIMTWANPGPGAARGLCWVRGVPLGRLGALRKRDQQELLQGMQELLLLSRTAEHWPTDWPAWEMRDVEHTLCEYDKYRRAQRGSTLKARYRPWK